MTKKHFIDAAAIVRNILEGGWTNVRPDWAPMHPPSEDIEPEDYMRAVQTAEVFLLLFHRYNDRFDCQRFLIACGLAAKPVKVKAPRKVRA